MTTDTLPAALREILGDDLPAIRAVAFQRLETALAQIAQMAANDSRMSNYYRSRIERLSERLVAAEGRNDEADETRLQRRLDSAVKVQLALHAQVKDFTEHALVIARGLGMDTGEARSPGVGSATVDGASVEVTSAPEGFKFKRSSDS